MAQKIYGMGNPLLDISAEVGADMLTKYELQPANAILAEDKHKPLYAELAALDNVLYIPGGATLNSIRVANWMLKSKNPGQCSYSGCIGTDKFAEIMESKCKDEGLTVPFMKVTDTETGTCGVLVVGKERSLVANLAAANKFDVAHMDTDGVKAAYEGAGIYYIAGFFLTVSVPSILKVAEHASANSKTLCLNLSAPFICQFFKDQLAQVMPYVDVVFANEDEAAVYAKEHGIDSTDLEVIANAVQKLEKKNAAKPRVVCFTQGSKATIIANGTKTVQVPVAPVAPDSITDTNGAGDAFVGGFLAGLSLGKSLEDCALCGHYAAGVIIQNSGCTFPAAPTPLLF